LFDTYEDENELFIVMELCEGGELFDRIKSEAATRSAGAYTEKDASQVLRQAFQGLKYMHDQKIAHCDLKPDNFMFLTTARDSPLKIIDFGMSKFVRRRKYFESLAGTPYYVAPEVIQGHYSEHCDLWSLGVVMFVMIFGYPPFYADQEVHGQYTDEKIFELIRAGFEAKTKEGYGAHFPSAIPCSNAAKDLMTKLLETDPAKRISASEALEHAWLTGELADDTPRVSAVLRNLSNFSANYKFKRAVLSMMTDSLTDAELTELKKTFAAIDTNGDGVITFAEMKAALEKWGNDPKSADDVQHLATLMKVADLDGDGKLSYQELLLTVIQRKLTNKEERLWAAFRKMDLNGDGRVSVEEIQTVLGAQNARELIAEADKNNDGSVDYDEFLTMWMDRESKTTASSKTAASSTTKTTPSKTAPASVTATAPSKDTKTGSTSVGAKAVTTPVPSGTAVAMVGTVIDVAAHTASHHHSKTGAK